MVKGKDNSNNLLSSVEHILFLTIMLSDSEGVIQSDYIVYAEEYLRSKEITIDTKIPKTHRTQVR